MKYSEFKAEVEKLGYEVEENPNTVVAFRESDGSIIGKVYKQTTACLDTKWSSFVSLKDNEKNELFDLFARLAKTPLAEREEEKRYRVKLPAITRSGNAIYLQRETSSRDPIGIDWSEEGFIYSNSPESYMFTEKEIKAIDEAYWQFRKEVTE